MPVGSIPHLDDIAFRPASRHERDADFRAMAILAMHPHGQDARGTSRDMAILAMHPHGQDARGTSAARIAKLALTIALLFLAANILVGKDAGGKLAIETTAFHAGGAIPTPYTCSGENRS